jgi:drug/metabolite transporter (DMT)-like permease
VRPAAVVSGKASRVTSAGGAVTSAGGAVTSAGGAAGLVWGLAFLLPVLLPGWTAMTVTAGRYLAYGAVSLIFVAIGGRGLRDLTRRHWRPALAFALTGNAGYYLLLVLGIKLAGAPVTDIVIGCIPVAVTLAGNVTSRAQTWRALAFPVVLVLAGLLAVNVLQVRASAGHGPLAATLLGLLAAFGAVVAWTWYALANASFLRRHPDVPPGGLVDRGRAGHWRDHPGGASGGCGSSPARALRW